MNWDAIKQEWETSKITLKDLAAKHDIKLGTLKSRKSRESWSRDATKKDATKHKKVATQRNAKTVDKQKNRSGNPNPSHKFPKHNSLQTKHGLYSKFLHNEQIEIIEAMDGLSIADQLWVQIEIKFSAIIRMQKIMWVEDASDTLSDESMVSSGSDGSMTSYKVAYAYEQYESYIKAQARAMAEYRNLIKQFKDLAHDEDERKLKLQLMQHQIDKTKKETEKLSQDTGDDLEEIIIVDEWGHENADK